MILTARLEFSYITLGLKMYSLAGRDTELDPVTQIVLVCTGQAHKKP
jgi:hypothetical protein